MNFIKYTPAEMFANITAAQGDAYVASLNRPEDVVAAIVAIPAWLATEIEQTGVSLTTFSVSQTEAILKCELPDCPHFINQVTPLGTIINVNIDNIHDPEWLRDLWVNLQAAKLIVAGMLELDPTYGWKHVTLGYVMPYVQDMMDKIQALAPRQLTYADGFYIGSHILPWVRRARADSVAHFGTDSRHHELDALITAAVTH